MRPQSAKAKGRNLQKSVSQKVTEVFELEEGDVVSRPMGSGGADIMMSPAARRACPVTFECKSTTAVPGQPALDQAQYNAVPGTWAAVIWKPRGVGPDKARVMMELEEFLVFVKALRKESK